MKTLFAFFSPRSDSTEKPIQDTLNIDAATDVESTSAESTKPTTNPPRNLQPYLPTGPQNHYLNNPSSLQSRKRKKSPLKKLTSPIKIATKRSREEEATSLNCCGKPMTKNGSVKKMTMYNCTVCQKFEYQLTSNDELRAGK